MLEVLRPDRVHAGKLQITLPKAVAERCGIRGGDELDVRPMGPCPIVAFVKDGVKGCPLMKARWVLEGACSDRYPVLRLASADQSSISICPGSSISSFTFTRNCTASRPSTIR